MSSIETQDSTPGPESKDDRLKEFSSRGHMAFQDHDELYEVEQWVKANPELFKKIWDSAIPQCSGYKGTLIVGTMAEDEDTQNLKEMFFNPEGYSLIQRPATQSGYFIPNTTNDE